MTPTLRFGERVKAEALAGNLSSLGRFEIVALAGVDTGTQGPRFFRVVGFPGETIYFTLRGIVVDERLVDFHPLRSQGFLVDTSRPCFGCHEPYVVPDDSYYLLGDNLAKARDSRERGAFPAEQITHRVILSPK